MSVCITNCLDGKPVKIKIARILVCDESMPKGLTEISSSSSRSYQGSLIATLFILLEDECTEIRLMVILNLRQS